MATCTLNGKEYHIDFVTDRALREIEPAAKMYSRVVMLSNAAVNGGDLSDAHQLTVSEALDVMIKWFCLLFQNQFTPDELLDGYPVDRLMHDIAFALWLSRPRPPAFRILSLRRQRSRRRRPDGNGGDSASLTLPEFIYSTYITLLENGWKMKEIDEMDMLGYFIIYDRELSIAYFCVKRGFGILKFLITLSTRSCYVCNLTVMSNVDN